MILRELASAALRFSGIPSLIRHVVCRHRVTIVVYHDPEPETLDRHLDYLGKRYRLITLDQLVDALHSGDWTAIPRYGLVMTLDDGHRGNRLLAPIFEKHGVFPTIYVCTQIIATKRAFWFLKCEHSLAQRLKRLPQDQRLRMLDQECGFSQTREESEATALTEEEIFALQEHATLASHTRFHPILVQCSDTECDSEIRRSRDDLEEVVGEPCQHFSYPNGDYSDREIAMVKRAGYRSARTTDVGWNGLGSDPFRLRVTGVTDNASINMLAVQLSGLIAYFRCLARGNWKGSTGHGA